MVQLKQVSLRLKSIKNIQKITKTMKMVSASKFTKAERELQAARPFGYGPRKFYQTSHLVKGPVEIKTGKGAPAPTATPAPTTPEEIKEEDKKLRKVLIAMTSDRGLCGGVHSGVARRVRREVAARGADAVSVMRLVCVGDKARSMLWRANAPLMLISVKDLGRIAPVFADASLLAAAVAGAGYPYDSGEIFYNHYHTPVKYELSSVPFFTKIRIESAPNMSAFDEADEDLESYAEWTLAALLFYALKQGAAAEQSARMAAMDNATENAAAMIRSLTLLYNRTRQAVITRELIEIISGAAALK